MTKKNTWPRVKDFINMILFAAVTYNDIKLEETEFDGIAGKQFNKAVSSAAEGSEDQRNYYIGLAVKLKVPIEGLEADGEFGQKWKKVVAFCKAEKN